MKSLKKNLDNVRKRLLEKDQDFVLVVDGREGVGKSSLALHIATYFDPKFNVDKICFNISDFKKQLFKSKRGGCILIDEGALLAMSRNAMTSDNREFMKIMTICRKFNQLIIICIPNINIIDSYIRNHRVAALVRVTKLARYAIYSKKKLNSVRKHPHSSKLIYPRPNIRESFPKFNGELWPKYLKKKDLQIYDQNRDWISLNKYAKKINQDPRTVKKRIEDGALEARHDEDTGRYYLPIN